MTKSLRKQVSKLKADGKLFYKRKLHTFLPLLAVVTLLILAAVFIYPSWHHRVSEYGSNSLYHLAQTDTGHMLDFSNTLDEILRPRVSGTDGNTKVREYLSTSMKNLGWQVEEDSFEAPTPMGKKRFTNVMATLDPSSCRQMVLACHFDSKLFTEFSFMGATDSAVPCAMLVHLARALHEPLQESPMKGNVSLQLLFLDGEEAFVKWSETDSLYGARHLAELWNNTAVVTSDKSKVCKRNGENMVTRLNQIDVFILLDLVGSANPRFYSYFPNTFSLYQRLHIIEKKLNELGMLEAGKSQTSTGYFANKASFSFVEDDHIPFMQRGVPIIHLIPSPFPRVWHKASDNRESLHHPTINNLNKILRIFVAQYFHLDPTLYVRRST